MQTAFTRTRWLLGDAAMQCLQDAHVAVFGLGGVGSFAAEALGRSGVGALSLFDHDTVSVTNLNRQLIATRQTIGQRKVDAMQQRLWSIDPHIRVTVHATFYAADNADAFDLRAFDYIVDAIDTVSSKLLLIERAQEAGVPIVSSMGTGNKLDPGQLQMADIYDTAVCPLARVMRRELRRRGVQALQVVYSREQPCTPLGQPHDGAPGRRQTPGSVAFVPPVAGMMLAGYVVRTLAARAGKKTDDLCVRALTDADDCDMMMKS